MDTPAKSAALSASATDYEDSPVFHYINNLSPLELVKSSGTNQPFNLLSSASPLAVFASPQLDPHKEHLKLQRNQLPSSSALEFLENRNKDSLRLGVLKSDEECHATDGKSGFKSVVSDEHNAVMPTENAANLVASHTTTMHEQEYASTVASSGRFVDGHERNIHNICHTEQSMQDSVKMVPAADSDVINFKASNHLGNDGIDPGSVVSTADIVHYPQVSADEEPKLEYAGLVNFHAEEQKLDVPALALSRATLHELGMSDSAVDLDEINEVFTRSYRQSTLLRRCLFSEMATTNYNSEDTSISILDIGEVVKWDSEVSDMPSASDYLVSGDLSPMSSSDVNQVISLGRDLILYDDEVPQIEDQNGPLMKRSRLEQETEIISCNRCNCRRSKCLKLYCDCFAAGLYCIEPCSCQDCFNRPIFKDKVLETRKLIENRNPLAFAPKVIRGTDADKDRGEEGNKTPASARHKQGCRCKRSSCLKKYCECFQVGVGCSLNCRCEGCKNTYGRKDEPHEPEGRDGETYERVRSSHVTAKNEENEEECADPLKRDTAHDRIQKKFHPPSQRSARELSYQRKKLQESAQLGNGVSTFAGKHTLEKQDEMTPYAENRDVNRETLSSKCWSPGTLKNSPRGKGVPQSLQRARPASSSTAMWSGRRRAILRSIASFGKTRTEAGGKD